MRYLLAFVFLAGCFVDPPSCEETCKNSKSYEICVMRCRVDRQHDPEWVEDLSPEE